MFNFEKQVNSKPITHSKSAPYNKPEAYNKSATCSKHEAYDKPATYSKPAPYNKLEDYTKPEDYNRQMNQNKSTACNKMTVYNNSVEDNEPASYKPTTNRQNVHTIEQHIQSRDRQAQHIQAQQKEQRTYNEKNHNHGWAPIPSQQKETTKLALFISSFTALFTRKKKGLIVGVSIAMTLALLATVFIFTGPLNVKYGISINGRTDIVLTDRIEAQGVLDEIKEYYTEFATEEDVVNVSSVTYEEEVQVIETKGHASEIKNKDEAKQVLLDGQYLNVIIEGICKDTEEIDFETETKKDSTLPAGTTKIQQEGEKGSKDITYTFISKNGGYLEKTVLQEDIVKDPVPEIILEGTKTKPEYVPASSQNVEKRDMEMLEHIIKKESGGNVRATNGKYKGIGQLQESHYQTYVGMSYAETLQQADPYAVQLEAMLGYIKGRYGSVQAAYNFRAKNGWY